MAQELWSAVDEYFSGRLHKRDEIFDQILDRSATAGLPEIHVSACQGKFLQLLVRIQRAKRILEIGTLAGYSTVWMAQGMPADGKIVTLEADAKHAEVARSNFALTGLSDLIELREGPALETLPQLEDDGVGPFDLTFIDADKVNIPAYFDWSVKLSRPGAIVIVDNVVREGAILDETSDDPSVQGVQRLTEHLANDDRAAATVFQTVGAKGHDGFILAVVN